MITQIKQWFGLGGKAKIDESLYPADPFLKAFYKQREHQPHTTFCHAPSVNMYFDRRGIVVACCHSRNYILGEYPKNSIREIWEGKQAEQLREDLKNNDLKSGCLVCKVDLDRRNYGDIRANHFDQLERHPEYPTMMEFELDSTCNLECIMCSGDFSTSIRKNRDKLPPIQSPYDDAFVEQLKEFLPYLKEARFSGGEPFLIPKYYDIWEELIRVNPNCLISVQTNGTVLNNKVKQIIEKGRFEIGISLDSITPEHFEEIRLNAKHERVMENVEFFQAYCRKKKTPFRLSMCVMRNNWREMPQYVRMCNDYNAYCSFHEVHRPIEMSLYSLPTDELEAIYKTLETEEFTAKGLLQQRNREHYYSYVNALKIICETRREEEWQPKYTNDNLSDEQAIDLFSSYITQGTEILSTDYDYTAEELEERVSILTENVRFVQQFAIEMKVAPLALSKLDELPIEVILEYMLRDKEEIMQLMQASISDTATS